MNGSLGRMDREAESMAVNTDPLWTAADLAAFLKVSRRTIFCGLAAGRYPVVRLPNGHPRFVPSEICRWLAVGCPPASEFAEMKARGSLDSRMRCV